jgi:CRP/FNR family transcriptional regulator, cyclic AMP receptor protein
MKTLDHVLAEHPFFQGLAPEYLQLMRGCATNASYETDAYIFREGEPAGHFYVVRRGRVALEISAAQLGIITVETADAGEVFGWSWLFAPYRWHFSARAVEPTGVTMLDGVCLREKCERDHDFGYELVKRVSHIIIERLQATRMQLLDAYNTSSRGWL